MSVQAHLKELRGRMLVIALFFIVFSSLAYVYREIILQVLLRPLDGQALSYLTPGGGFSFIFTITMWTGLAFALPIIVFNLYRFAAPALPKRAQTKAWLVLLVSFILLMCGALFGYFYAIPGAINFLLGFADEYIQAMLTADSYLNFVIAYTIGLGILFQIPLLLIIIHWITPLKPKKLLSFERYVIVASFIAAAIITPTPDVVNQLVIALPIILMYQVGVIAVAWMVWRERRARKARLQKEETPLPPPKPVATIPVLPVVEQVPQPAPPRTITQKPAFSRSIDGLYTNSTLSLSSRSRPNPVINRNFIETRTPRIREAQLRTRSIDGIRPLPVLARNRQNA